MFEKTEKQIALLNTISSCTTSLAYGGGRSGKTVGIVYAILVRAMHYAQTWHLMARQCLSHAKISLWYKTIPDVVKMMGVSSLIDWHDTNLILRFKHNDSRIMVAGLDDKERVEKILGNEYATEYLNEASQISWESYETVRTRLNPPKGVPARMIIDYNPPSVKHWGYKLFHERKLPDGMLVDANDYKFIKMNPCDNPHKSEEYIKTLESLSYAQRKRFLDGEYSTEEGALWRRENIRYKKPQSELLRVFVGVDPSGSKDGDEVGIVVAGKDESGIIYILEDASLHGTPKEWSDEVYRVYEKYKADKVIAERNFGGDMVDAVISRSGQRHVAVELVTASRGKIIRAEPISALYERGLVFHAKEFTELETEICTYKGGDDDSPNRMDALVWACTKLIEQKTPSIRMV